MKEKGKGSLSNGLRRSLSLLIAAVMIFTMIPINGLLQSAYATVFSGGGTEKDPYLIENLADLEYLSESVNGGVTYEGKYFKLTNDIDMTTKYNENTDSWTPIGLYNGQNDGTDMPFNGSFDGDGHIITLYLKAEESYSNYGLFGYVGGGGTVKNLGVDGEVYSEVRYAAGIASFNKGNLENCYNKGKITARLFAGGVVANNYGTIKNCYNEGSVSGHTAGGVVDSNSGTIEYCWNNGNVKGTASNASEYSGGISASMLGGAIYNCYNIGAVSGTNNVGGICGYMGNTPHIANCYNIGTVSGNNNVGGISGNTSGGGVIKNCYNTGNISSSSCSSPKIGGILGQNENPRTTFSSCCYYDENKCTTASDETSYIAGISTDNFKIKQVFINGGWDFDTLWGMSDDRPVLRSVEEYGKHIRHSMSTDCSEEADLLTFEPLTNEVLAGKLSGDYYVIESGNYYLAEDITPEYEIQITDKKVNLCLNGHTISRSGTDASVINTISVSGESEFNICDCSDGGEIIISESSDETQTGVSGGAINVSGDTTLNIYGGTISAEASHRLTAYGAVYVSEGSTADVNIYGGRFKGFQAPAVNIWSGTLTVNGEDVEILHSCPTQSGAIMGGVFARKDAIININQGEIYSDGYSNGVSLGFGGTLNITGGNIKGHQYGIWIDKGESDNPNKINISGGTITGNKATAIGTSFSHFYYDISISGNPEISGVLTIVNDEVKSDIYLGNYGKIVISGELTNTEAYMVRCNKDDNRDITKGWSTYMQGKNPEDYFKLCTYPKNKKMVLNEETKELKVRDIIITMDANGGEFAAGAADTVEVTNYYGRLADQFDTLPQPTRQYYDFSCWTTEKDNPDTEVTKDTVFTDDTTIYAYYTHEHIYGDWSLTQDEETGEVTAKRSCPAGHRESIPVYVSLKESEISAVYSGSAKTPKPTVTMYGEDITDSFDMSWSDNTDVGTAAITLTGKNGFGGTITKTFEITPAVLTVTGAKAEDRDYDGTNMVSITDITLDGIKNGNDVKASAVLMGTLDSGNAGTYDKIKLPELTLTGAKAKNYTLVQPEGKVTLLTPVVISRAAVPEAVPGRLEIKNNLSKTYSFPLSSLRPEEADEAGWGNEQYEIVSAEADSRYLSEDDIKLEGNILKIKVKSVQDVSEGKIGTVTVKIKTNNYENFTGTVEIYAANKAVVSITGVTGKDGTYGDSEIKGYDGTPKSPYTGTYEYLYVGTGDTRYNSKTAPVKAGTYMLIIRIPDADEAYAGETRLDFTIKKSKLTAAVAMKDYSCKELSVMPVPVCEQSGTDYVIYRYYDESGNLLGGRPETAGSYKVQACFPETRNYEAAVAEAAFTVSHGWSGETIISDDGHYQLCACGEKSTLTEHVWSEEYTVLTYPTKQAKGSALISCTGAPNHKKALTLPMLSDQSAYTQGKRTEPTTTSEGSQEYTLNEYSFITFTASIPRLALEEETELNKGDTVKAGDAEITYNDDGTITITKENAAESTTVTLTQGTRAPVVNTDGTVTVPKGSTVKTGADGAEIYLADGGITDADGNVTAGKVEVGGTEIAAPENGTVITDKDGTTAVTEGSIVITGSDGETVTLPTGSTVDKNGNITIPSGGTVKTGENGDELTFPSGGTVSITDGSLVITGTVISGNAAVTAPKGDTLAVQKDGTITAPAGSTVSKGGNELTLVDEGTVEKDKSITVTAGKTIVTDSGVKVTNNGDNTITITKEGETGNTVVTLPEGVDDVTVSADGILAIPSGSTVTDKNGDKLTLPSGGEVSITGGMSTGSIAADIIAAGSVIIGDTTITTADGNVITVKNDTAAVPPAGTVQTGSGAEVLLPNGGSADGKGNIEADVIKIGNTTVTVPAGKNVSTDEKGNIVIPEGSKVTSGGTSVTILNGEGTVDNNGKLTAPSGSTAVTEDGTKVSLPVGGQLNSEGMLEAEKAVVGNTAVTAPKGETVIIHKDGSMEVSKGGTIESVGTIITVTDGTAVIEKGGAVSFLEGGQITAEKDGKTEAVTVPQGGKLSINENDGGLETEIKPDTSVTVGDTTVTGNGDGTVTVKKTGEETGIIITLPENDANPTIDSEGNVTVPSGSIVKTDGGVQITLPSGGSVNSDKTVEAEKVVVGETIITAPSGQTVTVDKNGNTTVTAGCRVENGSTAVTVTEGTGTVANDGTITFLNGGSATVEKNGKTESVSIPAGGNITFNADDEQGKDEPGSGGTGNDEPGSGGTGSDEPGSGDSDQPQNGKIVKQEGTTPDKSISAALCDAIDVLMDIVFNEDELSLIAEGKNASIWMTVEDITGTVSEADRSLAVKAADGYKTGAFLDLNCFKQLEGGKAIHLTELEKEITVSLTIPEELKNTDSSIKRTYAVVRVHGSEAKLLEGSYDEKTGVLTFKTGLFSTYVICYRDEAVGNTSGGPASGNTKTGDNAPIALFTAVILLSGAVAVAAVSKKKRLTK